MEKSPYLPDPQFLPLKCGVPEEKPHTFLTETTVGTIQEGLWWHLAHQIGLLDILQQFMGIFFSFVSTMGIHLPHPSWPVAFMNLDIKWKGIFQEVGERPSLNFVLSLACPYLNFPGTVAFLRITQICGMLLVGLHLFYSMYEAPSTNRP